MSSCQSVEQFRESAPHLKRRIARFSGWPPCLEFPTKAAQIFAAPRSPDEDRFQTAGLSQVVTQEHLQVYWPQRFIFNQGFEAERVRRSADGQGRVGQLQ